MSILNYFKREPNATKRPPASPPPTPIKKPKVEPAPPPTAKSKFFTAVPDVIPDAFQVEQTVAEAFQVEEEITDAEEIKPEPQPPRELVTTTTEALAQRRSVLDDDFTQAPKNVKPGKKPGPLPKDLKDIKPRGKMMKTKGSAKMTTTKNEKKEAGGVRGPLTGKTFVITGVLEGIEREEIQDILKSYGGRVTGSVSRKTSFLIYGEKLEDGRRYTEGRKYQKAKELNVKIINQRQLDEILLRLRGGEALDPHADDEALAASFDAARASAAAPPSQRPIDSSGMPIMPRGQPIVSDDGRLWTEKYAPKTLKDVIGNAQAVEKLVNWVKDWEIVVLKGIKKDIRPMRGGRFDPQLNVNAKAALLSGPPGIGKTTTARLIARGLGYRAIEMNASDVRSKRAILEPLKASSGSSSLTNSGALIKSLVIMDEVDGMSMGDRGGIGALLEVIRSTQVPIICICNERACQKLKMLGNVSYDIRFTRPNKTQIAKKLQQITAKEGLQIEPNALEHIVECAGNDIRQVFTMLEMWARYSSTLSYCDAKSSEKLFRKDANVMINNFDAAGLLMRREELSKRNHRERMDLFFIDFDLIPLLVEDIGSTGASE